MLEIVNDHTLMIQSLASKTRWININDAKPISARAVTDTALQDFKQAAMQKEYRISSEVPLSEYKMMSLPQDILEGPENGKFNMFLFPILISQLPLNLHSLPISLPSWIIIITK